MGLALAWALRLEGKTNQEKFKALGWGLRTWDERNPQNGHWLITKGVAATLLPLKFVLPKA